MSEWLEIAKAFVNGLMVLAGVVLGWFLRRSDQQKLFKVNELRDRLDNVYSPLVGIVDKLEEKVEFVERSKQSGLALSTEEKRRLDRIMATSRHVLPERIWQHWLAKIKDLKPRPFKPMTHEEPYYPVSLDFKDMVKEEYNRRLKEYRKLTGEN